FATLVSIVFISKFFISTQRLMYRDGLIMKLFFYFSLFFIIQLVNSDLDTLTLYLLIKKIILSLLASVLFLFVLSFFNKKRK
ncbi:hypothetical protein DM428_23540, partial [Escherichia coli]|nr:hypothetical protein [Escherichia coli]